MPLTDVAVRNIKPSPKTIRLRDERGLYLEVSPKGGKWWRLRYTFQGKENMLSLGVYPDVSLKEARERRDNARKLIANDIDPSQARKEEKAEIAADAVTFERVAQEWFGKFKENWTPSVAGPMSLASMLCGLVRSPNASAMALTSSASARCLGSNLARMASSSGGPVTPWCLRIMDRHLTRSVKTACGFAAGAWMGSRVKIWPVQLASSVALSTKSVSSVVCCGSRIQMRLGSVLLSMP